MPVALKGSTVINSLYCNTRLELVRSRKSYECHSAVGAHEGCPSSAFKAKAQPVSQQRRGAGSRGTRPVSGRAVPVRGSAGRAGPGRAPGPAEALPGGSAAPPRRAGGGSVPPRSAPARRRRRGPAGGAGGARSRRPQQPRRQGRGCDVPGRAPPRSRPRARWVSAAPRCAGGRTGSRGRPAGRRRRLPCPRSAGTGPRGGRGRLWRTERCEPPGWGGRSPPVSAPAPAPAPSHRGGGPRPRSRPGCCRWARAAAFPPRRFLPCRGRPAAPPRSRAVVSALTAALVGAGPLLLKLSVLVEACCGRAIECPLPSPVPGS